MSKISGENLRAGMKFEEVAKVVGAAAVFKYESGSISTGQGMFLGQWQEHGEGTIHGTTLTEPRFRWSIYANQGLHRFKVGTTLTVQDLKSSGMQPDTFHLEAKK